MYNFFSHITNAIYNGNMKKSKELRNYISLRISRMRHAKKISARKLSEELGFGSEYINQIETGRNVPSIEGLYFICEYFNMTLSEFFDSSQAYPLEYKDIIKKLNMLDEEQLEHVTKTIVYISGNK